MVRWLSELVDQFIFQCYIVCFFYVDGYIFEIVSTSYL